MGVEEIHFGFDDDVRVVVNRALERYPSLRAYTYHNHPWPGWDGRSVDFDSKLWPDRVPSWRTLEALRLFLMALPGKPYIRHTILGHSLWTSFGGYSTWVPDDHSGRARHLHVTYWPA